MTKVLVDNFVKFYYSPLESIILDCDDSNAITHGQQQFSSLYSIPIMVILPNTH